VGGILGEKPSGIGRRDGQKADINKPIKEKADMQKADMQKSRYTKSRYDKKPSNQ
jgi:hypothetical protein